MLYRATGGLFLALYGTSALGLFSTPNVLMGILALVAGIALMIGK